MRVKGLAQEHNTMTRPRLEPGPLDPESSAVTIRQLRLLHVYMRQSLQKSTYCSSKPSRASKLYIGLTITVQELRDYFVSRNRIMMFAFF